jgi:crotonyl-CoA reductase
MNTIWAYGITKDKARELQRTPHDKRKPSNGVTLLEIPALVPKKNEVVVKVVTSALNYNSIWSANCYPVSPFQLINNHIRRNPEDADHAQDYAILGSDAAGIVTEVGADVAHFKPGDEVIIHCNVVSDNELLTTKDSMLSKSQSIWGYETNFGAFGEYTKTKASQLIKKPKNISWEVAGSYCLTLSTAYRMLISANGANLKSGEACLIWGAAGGLGSFAVQLCNLVGAHAIGIVGSEEKMEVIKSLGADFAVNRKSDQIDRLVDSNGSPQLLAWNKFGNYLKKIGCPNIDCVFEHVGSETLGASIYLLDRGGRVVICGASSGFNAQIDLRYLWMELKSVIGSHFANQTEAQEASDLIFNKKIVPLIHSINPLDSLGNMCDELFTKDISGKIVFSH